MGEHDKQLITEANAIPYVLWSQIESIIPNAHSEECKNELKRIKRRKELKEEYSAGVL